MIATDQTTGEFSVPIPLFVPAAPFAAWARHLVNTSGLPWPVIARAAGIGVKDLQALLGGQGGDLIPQPLANKLFALDPPRLAELATILGDSQLIHRHLLALSWLGLGVDTLARMISMTPRQVILLTGGATSSCTLLQQYSVEAFAELCGIDAQIHPGIILARAA